MERMPVVDRNILRLAVFEMIHGGTPAAVTIDEALELARKFSNEESVQFVNGVLDAIRREIPSACDSEPPDSRSPSVPSNV
jgi:N utilization substance protein B